MSQTNKKKKNPIISYMSKKRRFKKKFRLKVGNEVTGEGNSNIDDRREKDWFTDQYEKLIGKPLPKKEYSTDEVLRRLQESTKYRWVPEANTYKSLTPQTGNVHYIEWKDPKVKVCTCPDTECTCTGNYVMFPRKKIPRGERYIKSTFCRKLMQRFRKSTPPPTESFVQRLAAVVGVEASVYQDLERKGILNIRGAEFCISRCIRYYGLAHMPSNEYFFNEEKFQHERHQTPRLKNEKDEDDDRICNGSSCTVSTQSTVGPKGEFVIGNYSHVLYSTLDEAIVRDIEGKELQISSYKSVNDNFEHKSFNLCSFDKLLNVRELINVKAFRNQISLLKRHIYSSIFEIKEKPSLTESITSKSEEEYVNDDDSSEDVTIPTPYKGVVLKGKKKPQDCTKSNQPQQFTPTQNVTECEILPEPLKLKTSEIINSGKNIIAITPDIIKIKVNKSISDEKIEILQRKHSDEGKKGLLDSSLKTIRDVKLGETDKICPDPLLINLKDISEATVKESLNTKSQADSIEKNAEFTQNVNQSKEEIIHDISHTDVLKREKSGDNFVINSSKLINKNSEIETGTKRAYNYFKKRLYGFSIDQLQNIKIKKFIKSLSCESATFIHRNNGKEKQTGLKPKDNKSIVCINERLTDKNDKQLTSKTKPHLENSSAEEDSHLELFFLPNCRMEQDCEESSRKNKRMKSIQNVYSSVTENQDSGKKQPDDLLLRSQKEKDDTNSYIVTSVNTNIGLPSLHNTCSTGHKSKKPNRSSLINLEFKIGADTDNDVQENFIRSNNKAVVKVTSSVDDILKEERSKKGPTLTQKMSNLSSMLKRIIGDKIHKPVKSSPGPTIHTSFRKSFLTQMERKTYIKNGKKKNEEPKTSEKEMFSIQYSAMSEMKCSSQFLKIEQGRSYPGPQEMYDTQRSDLADNRRLTA